MDNFSVGRLAVCNTCEFNHNNDCILCGCHIPIKVLNKGEKCPHMPPKWTAYDETLMVPVNLGVGGFNSPSQEYAFIPAPVVCAVCPRRS